MWATRDVLPHGIAAGDDDVGVTRRNVQERGQDIPVVEHLARGVPGQAQTDAGEILLGTTVLVIVHLQHELRSGLQEIAGPGGCLSRGIPWSPSGHHIRRKAGCTEAGIAPHRALPRPVEGRFCRPDRRRARCGGRSCDFRGAPRRHRSYWSVSNCGSRTKHRYSSSPSASI